MKPFNTNKIIEQIKDTDCIDLFKKMYGEVDSIDEAHGALIVSKKFSSCDELIDRWDDVQHLVAAGLQENLSEVGLEHFVGDIYLVFILKDSVPCEYRQKIEQDKYCCKKYVLDNAQEDGIAQVLSERLPLLYKWDFSDSDPALVLGVNEEEIRRRLTRDLDSSVAKVLCETPNFDAQLSADLIKKILSEEMSK